MNKPEWRLKISGEIQYLTTEEKNYYLLAISQGKEFITFRDGRVFFNKFSFIEPINYRDVVEKLEQGKWQCDYKKWHEKDFPCNCMELKKLEAEQKAPEVTEEERQRALKKVDEIREDIHRKLGSKMV